MPPRSSHFRGVTTLPIAAVFACLGLAATGIRTGLAESPPVQATWTSLPLRDVADQLGRLAGRPLVLDRRIDPTQPISMTVAGEPLDAVIGRVAALAGAEVVFSRSLMRLAPKGTAARAAAAEEAVRREIARLPATQRAVLEKEAVWVWPAGSVPRELVDQQAAAQGIGIDGLHLVPHDHLPSATLPPLSLSERLDLVLAHFDMRVQWSRSPGGGVPRGRITPLPTEANATAQAAARPRQPGRMPPAPGTQAYTLRLEAPLQDALAAVTRQLGLAIDLDEASLAARGISPREIARANVRSASRDELLDAILAPLSLSWRIDDGTLRVWAEPP